MIIPVAKSFGPISAIKRWSIILLCGVFFATGGCKGGSGGVATGAANGGANGGGVTGGGGAGTGPIGAAPGGGGSPTGGNDTPTGNTPGGTPGDGGGGGGGGAGGGAGGVATLTPGDAGNGTTRAVTVIAGATDAEGFAVLPVMLVGANAVQYVTQDTNFEIAALLTDPSNEEVVTFRPPALAPQQTSAVFLNTHVNTLPYPTTPSDPAITTGVYTEGLVFSPRVTTGFTTTVTAKNDSNLRSGLLRANIFLVGTEAQKSENRDAVDRAIDIWIGVYAAVGISLDVQKFDVASGTGVLPNPVTGSDFYLTQAQAVRTNAVNVYLGQAISNTSGTNPGNDTGALLGVASAVPGPNIPTVTSAVAIDLVQHAGTDGVFSDAEVGVLGETLAHEAGHYLGLNHPVEFATVAHDSFIVGDLLVDTATCNSQTECVANGIAKNVMFPTPVGGVPQQRELSSQQGATLNLQVMVD